MRRGGRAGHHGPLRAPTGGTSRPGTCARSGRVRSTVARRLASSINIEGDPRPDLLDPRRTRSADQCTLRAGRAWRSLKSGRLAAGPAADTACRRDSGSSRRLRAIAVRASACSWTRSPTPSVGRRRAGRRSHRAYTEPFARRVRARRRGGRAVVCGMREQRASSRMR